MSAVASLMNPFILIVLMAVALAIVSGLAGRVAILLEDLHTAESAVVPHSHPRPPRLD